MRSRSVLHAQVGVLGVLFALGACSAAGCSGASNASEEGTSFDDGGTPTDSTAIDGTPSDGFELPDTNGADGGGPAETSGDDTGTGTDTDPGIDGGAGETSAADSGGSTDTDDVGGTTDTAIDDTAIDAGDPDTGGVVDTGGVLDTGVVADTAAPDTAVVDSGDPDTGVPDTFVPDTGTPDLGPPDVGDPCDPALKCTLDTDLDGIPDAVEGRCAPGGPLDTDGDGIPDYLDLDSDGDGIPDKTEWFGKGCDPTDFLNDADGDGIPNFRDLDSDGNGLPDSVEFCPPVGMPGRPVGCSLTNVSDFDGDGVPDFLDNDNDHDSASPALDVGLEDKYELTNAAGVYVGLVDTDGDGIPDLYDRDSDNDTIFDLNDGLGDLDKDGKQNFRDTDSDGDGVPDRCEARNNPAETDFTKPLLDTDGDGKPDYLDVDSDGDLLPDGAEDKNGNCLVSALETNRLLKDTDGDGVDDLIEASLSPAGANWGNDATKTPANQNKFYFVVPHSTDGSAPATPLSSLLALSTQLNKADVGFVMDGTGTMAGEINNLKTTLSATVIPALKARIPDLQIGVAAHVEFPIAPYGVAGNRPYYIANPPNGYVTAVTANSQAAMNSLATLGNTDEPEAQVVAMYKALTGVALTWPGGSIAADAPLASTGTFGSLRFRTDAFTIVIHPTDRAMHNGKRALNKAPTGVAADYDAALQHTYAHTAPNVDQLVTTFNTLGAKFIGLTSDEAGTRETTAGDPLNNSYGYLAFISDKTTSYGPPSVFGAGSTQCKTGIAGANIAADGPTVGGVRQCRMVFSLNKDGTGVGLTVVDAVFALLSAIKFDVYVEAYNGVGEPIDVVTAFMTKVEPQPSGGTDPVSGSVCEVFPASQLADLRRTPKALAGAGDIQETITALNPGKYYCYRVFPKNNTTVAATSAVQTFRAWLRVHAVRPTGGTFTLGTDREVLFIVPPIVN